MVLLKQQWVVRLFVLSTFFLPNLAASQETKSINYDFCSLDDDIPPRNRSQIWSASAVQTYTKELLSNPAIIDSPWAAYPIAYVTMTKERDIERCGGNLSSSDRQNRLIGDLLADIMSRWLIMSVESCSTGFSPSDPDYGFCAAMNRIKQENYDSLKAAVEMTAVYLSSHMAMSLVAVAFDDPFWNQEFSPDTHCLPNHNCGEEVLIARLNAIKRYKKLYDKNNYFLAENLRTVINTLHNACYLQGPPLAVGADIASLLPGVSLVFGSIRDQTFAAALKLIKSMAREDHPMIRTDGRYREINYEQFAAFIKMPPPLRHAERHARFSLANPAWTWTFGLLGSLDWDDLRKITPSHRSSCVNYSR